MGSMSNYSSLAEPFLTILVQEHCGSQLGSTIETPRALKPWDILCQERDVWWVYSSWSVGEGLLGSAWLLRCEQPSWSRWFCATLYPDETGVSPWGCRRSRQGGNGEYASWCWGHQQSPAETIFEVFEVILKGFPRQFVPILCFLVWNFWIYFRSKADSGCFPTASNFTALA